MKKKKTIILTIIGVITLLIVVIGATYAYFAVQATNNFGTFTGTATTPTLGTVTLTSGSPFELNVSRSDMMDENQGTYYAVGDNSFGGTIATASVTGDGTFNCTYTLTGTLSGTMMDVVQAYDAEVYINGTEYDVYANKGKTITFNGRIYGVKEGADKTLLGNIAIKNRHINQNHLIDKTLTFTATVSSFDCTAVEDDYKVPGLYESGSNYTVLLKSLEEMSIEKYVTIGENSITYNPQRIDTDYAEGSSDFDGDLIVPSGYDNVGFLTTVGSVRAIIFPEGVKKIDAPYGTVLDYIELPKSLEEIYDESFMYVNEDITIKYNGTMDEWNNVEKGYNVFYNGDSYAEYTYEVICTDGTLTGFGEFVA